MCVCSFTHTLAHTMGYTKLHEAVEIGDIMTLQQLLDSGTFDVNERDEAGV